MKVMGICRSIDDLGRICIPKEIRRTIGLKEGDSMEIFSTEKGLLLQKCNAENNLSGFDLQNDGFQEDETPNHYVRLSGNYGDWTEYLVLTPSQLRFFSWLQEVGCFCEDVQLEEIDSPSFKEI